MARVKPPFASTKKGIAVNLGPDERGLLRTLLGEVRELLTTAPIGDPKLARLFPPAYFDNDEAETEYQRLMRDELLSSRLASLSLTSSLLEREPSGDKVVLSADELDALMRSINSLRLVLGTLLDVDEDEFEARLDENDPGYGQYQLYSYLGWLLDWVVTVQTEFN